MVRVRYIGDRGRYRVAGHTFEPGDEHDVSAERANYLTARDDFERTDSNTTSDAGDSDPTTSQSTAAGRDPPFDPSEFTVDELEARLADADLDAEDLTALAAAERNGDGRDTALDAIDSAAEEA